jgi:hypothetical protein
MDVDNLKRLGHNQYDWTFLSQVFGIVSLGLARF